MSVERVYDGQSAEVARGAAAASARGAQADRKASARDGCEFSALGRLMLRSAEEFRSAGKPREDRIREFRDRMDEPVAWSDDAVGTLLRKMQDA